MNMRRVSGANIGARAKRIIGCDNCNHMEDYDVAKKRTQTVEPAPINEPKKSKGKKGAIHKAVAIKTGDGCPRCSAPTLRIFDSTAEFGRAQELKILQDQGVIKDLEYQTRFRLHAPDFETNEPVEVTSYLADFTYFETFPDGTEDYVVEDVKGKGVITDMAVMKLKWLKAEYGIDVKIVER